MENFALSNARMSLASQAEGDRENARAHLQGFLDIKKKALNRVKDKIKPLLENIAEEARDAYFWKKISEVHARNSDFKG
eukprot:GSA25T00016752001.1